MSQKALYEVLQNVLKRLVFDIRPIHNNKEEVWKRLIPHLFLILTLSFYFLKMLRMLVTAVAISEAFVTAVFVLLAAEATFSATVV